MLPILAACTIFQAAQAKPAPPAADLSAEPALQQLFVTAGAFRNVHLVSRSFYYNSDVDRWGPGSYIDFWLGEGGRFRMENTDLYGGAGRIVVSDGMTTLTDELNDDSSITLSNASKFLHSIDKNDPLFYLMEGQSGFDASVQKDKDIKFVPAAKGMKAIELQAKDLGKVVVTYTDGPSMFPLTIDQYRAPWWSDDPTAVSDKPAQRENISLVGYGPFKGDLFAVSAPKGHKITDQRTTAKM